MSSAPFTVVFLRRTHPSTQFELSLSEYQFLPIPVLSARLHQLLPNHDGSAVPSPPLSLWGNYVCSCPPIFHTFEAEKYYRLHCPRHGAATILNSDDTYPTVRTWSSDWTPSTPLRYISHTSPLSSDSSSDLAPSSKRPRLSRPSSARSAGTLSTSRLPDYSPPVDAGPSTPLPPCGLRATFRKISAAVTTMRTPTSTYAEPEQSGYSPHQRDGTSRQCYEQHFCSWCAGSCATWGLCDGCTQWAHLWDVDGRPSSVLCQACLRRNDVGGSLLRESATPSTTTEEGRPFSCDIFFAPSLSRPTAPSTLSSFPTAKCLYDLTISSDRSLRRLVFRDY